MELKSPCPVRVVEVKVELPDIYPVLILEEIEPPNRRLSFSVGSQEGMAIALAQKQISTPRPLTHEFIQNLLNSFEIAVEVVRINKQENGNFHAEIVLSNAKYGNKSLDARPSDAIILALRQMLYVPIVVEEELLGEVSSVDQNISD